ncbi:MAG: hypothetical protein OEV74_01755 [Cyclobacteriaceae bacterium]|nr:hypothetical protein [Cyclobacteriaceae bacterium]MDH4294975.1 hypothetical protein [Cyclobacteriaceae bacterium]MDH5249013.1 hypothetical protein [Cyclobacteriaceae bacterium]
MRVKIIGLLYFLIFSLAAQAQPADQIIGKYTKFIGGKKKWRRITTITTSGEYNYGGIPFPFHTYAKVPNRYKFIVPFNGKYYAQAFDGTKGWKIDAFKNETVPTLLTGKDAMAMANEADVELQDALIDYQRKGHAAISEGRENKNGVPCYRVKFIRKSGETELYYFNEQTFALHIKSAVAKNVELQGALLETTFSDYRNVQGVKIPFQSISESNGQVILTITIDKAVLNESIDDKEFQP